MKYYLFLTNIYKDKAVHLIEKLLEHYFVVQEIDFEISNKKSILRISGKDLSPLKIKSTLNDLGYHCREMNLDQ